MKVLKYIFCIILFLSFLISALKIGRIEIDSIKNFMGEYWYTRIYLIYIIGNFILLPFILFSPKFKKKEKEHHALMIFSLPMYNIYLILKKF